MYNKAFLIGRLGQDPELKIFDGGVTFVTFSLATNEYWKNKAGDKQERTEWHRIVAFGRLAEICDKYLVRGRLVFIGGRIKTRNWLDKNGVKRYTTEILLMDMKILDSKVSNSIKTSNKKNISNSDIVKSLPKNNYTCGINYNEMPY